MAAKACQPICGTWPQALQSSACRRSREHCCARRYPRGSLGFDVVQREAVVLCNIQVVALTEACLLVGLVSVGPNEFLNVGLFKQFMNIVIVTHDFNRIAAVRLLLAEFRRNGLKLFNEGVTGLTVRYRHGTVIDDVHVACDSPVVEPRTDVLGRVRRHRVEADLQQDALTEAFHGFDDRRVVQLDAGAAIVRQIVELGVALDSLDAVNPDLANQPIVEVFSGLDLCGAVLVLADFYILAGERLDQNINVFRKPADDLVAFGKRRAAFELETEAELIKSIKAVHDPVVFFDQGRINALLFRHNPGQIRKLRVVEEIVRHAVHSLSARVRRISWRARFRTREPRDASASDRSRQHAPPRA